MKKCGFKSGGPSYNEKLEEIITNLIVEQPALVQPLGKQLMYKMHEKVWFPVWGAKLQWKSWGDHYKADSWATALVQPLGKQPMYKIHEEIIINLIVGQPASV